MVADFGQAFAILGIAASDGAGPKVHQVCIAQLVGQFAQKKKFSERLIPTHVSTYEGELN